MVSGCIVPGCTKKYRKEQTASLHSFPLKDTERCKLWLRAIQHPDIGEDASIELLKKKRVCSLHFKPKDFLGNIVGMSWTRPTLTETAVPSVFAVGPLQDNRIKQVKGTSAAVIRGADDQSTTLENAVRQTYRLNISNGPRMYFEQRSDIPAKRLRFEDATNEPTDSNTELNGGTDTTTDITTDSITDRRPKTRISKSELRLKSLILTCPACYHDCKVKTWRLGMYDTFIQRCTNCTYTRKWLGMEAESSNRHQSD